MKKKTLFGRPMKDWKILSRMMKSQSPKNRFLTVAEYLDRHPEVKTEYRTSKKGVELIKVFYPSGVVKEYEVKCIDTSTAFDI